MVYANKLFRNLKTNKKMKNTFKKIGKVGIYNIHYSDEKNAQYRNKFLFIQKNKVVFSALNLYRVVAFIMRKIGTHKLNEKQHTNLLKVAKEHKQKLLFIKSK